MEKNWLFLTWQWNTSIEAEPRLSIALCFHNKSDTKSNTFRLAFFTMISIIIIIISVITGFALQYQFLEEVGSIGVSLWGQRVGWWWSWLTAPDRAQAPVSVAERCSGRSVCRLARIFRNLAIYNFVEFAFKQMLAKKKSTCMFLWQQAQWNDAHSDVKMAVTPLLRLFFSWTIYQILSCHHAQLFDLPQQTKMVSMKSKGCIWSAGTPKRLFHGYYGDNSLLTFLIG